jgi:hypothetical protein
MRTSFAGAAFLLVGAGAVTVAAVGNDSNGNSIAFNGSDTLHDVAIDVLNACGTVTASPFSLSYQGGGSGVGVTQMQNNNQQIAPMSKAMKSGDYCGIANVATALGASCPGFVDQASCEAPTFAGTTTPVIHKCTWNGTSCVAGSYPNISSHQAADLLLGLDGVSIVANETNACTSSTIVPPATDPVSNGFAGTANSMTVTADGTSGGGAPATCPGCSGTTYTFTDAFDALRVLYLGAHNDSTTAPTYDCSSPVRKTLIKQWRYIFSTPCALGNTNCPTGIQHAWRRSDLAGTSDAFLGILFGGDAPNKGSIAVGIGTPKTVSLALQKKKMDPFCNTTDANASPPVTSLGGSGDYTDADPVRVNCAATTVATNPFEDVCAPFRTPSSIIHNRGDLGVVLPILIPDVNAVSSSAWYNDTLPVCSGSCTRVAIAKSAGSLRCPGGNLPAGGECLMPYTGDNDPRCFSGSTIKCSDTNGFPDSRVYNEVVVVDASTITDPTLKAGDKYQFAIDAVKDVIQGAFYRVHEKHAGPGGTLCKQDDDTSQIGCLIESEPCSIGFAGREAAAIFPTSGAGTKEVGKALSINGVLPFSPPSVSTDPDFAIKNLFTGGTPLYPLSRRLYLATMYGFGNLNGGESLLAGCFENNANVGSAISNRHFVNVPPVPGFAGGVKCLDYPEEGSTTVPAPNVQGTGSQALVGCGLTSENPADACTGVTITGTFP